MRYIVDPETFAVSIYQNDAEVPFQYQPCYPNGDTFDSVEEASTWAEASIAAHSSEVLVFAPAGKGIPGETKPDPLARQRVLEKLNLNEEEVKVLLRGF